MKNWEVLYNDITKLEHLDEERKAKFWKVVVTGKFGAGGELTESGGKIAFAKSYQGITHIERAEGFS